MATLSSHVLDSVSGWHAEGIGVECWQLNADGQRTRLFDVVANEEGRVSESVDCPADTQIELLFHAKQYFSQHKVVDSKADAISGKRQVMDVVVVRMNIANADARYHIPVVLSPHSYTVWWSA